MASKSTPSRRKTADAPPPAGPGLRLLRIARWGARLGLAVFVLVLLAVLAGSFINPPRGHYMRAEAARIGAPVDRIWVPIDQIAPVMARSVVAAEDANFCLHWGFDMVAIRAALDAGGRRGASTITQQVVKNTYLWHGRSWLRKALEALLTPLVEATWSKRRILEVYLNVAEFDEGVFGVEAAARRYFRTGPEALTPVQAARLAMVLPSPQTRNAARPTEAQRRRSAAILDGAETIRRDGRDACFAR